MSARQQIDRDTYSLVITRRGRSELLCLADGPHYSLPSVEIPRWQRVAERINNAVKERWNLDAYSLSTCCLSDPLRDAASFTQFQVMECVRPDCQLPPKAYWAPVSALMPTSFRDSGYLRAIHAALGESGAHPASKNPGPFSKPGWLRDLCEWIQEQLRPLNLRLTGQFRQLTASPTFNLIRFETDGPALWFKAVGEPNVHEFKIVSTLATLFPLFLPRIIATRPEWNAWLMTEAEGTSPDAASDFAVWKAVSARLAQLQTASPQETDRLLAVGCRDLSTPSLLDRVDEFCATMDELMNRQTKTPPPILTSSELFALSGRLKEALLALAASGIPTALNHLDFNPGNVVVSDGNCVFLDWAEAAIGHPFLTLEYLLEHFKRLYPESPARHTELISTYAQTWQAHASPSAISRSLSLAPLAAVFAYAVSNETWRDPARLDNPQTAGYFRSLARRMKREADGLENRSLECMSL